MASENVIRELLDSKGPTISGVPGFGSQYNGYDPSGNGWTPGDEWPHVRMLRLNGEGVAYFSIPFPPEADENVAGVENWYVPRGEIVTGWTCIVTVIGKTVRLQPAEGRSWTNGAVGAYHVPVYERPTGHEVSIFGQPNQEFMLWFYRRIEITRGGYRVPTGPIPDDDEKSEV